MPPKQQTAGDGGGAASDADEPDSKRPKAATASAREGPPAGAVAGRTRGQQRQQQQQRQLERTTEVLFLVLKRQRQAARQARVAARENALHLTSPRYGASEFQLDGEGDDDGEGGAVTGAGWWREARVLHAGRFLPTEPRERIFNDDRTFLETCAACSRVCKTWRALAFRCADRATISWEGVEVSPLKGDGPHEWESKAFASRPPDDPLSLLRAFDGGVLKALCVRGEPDDKGRLRAFGRALGVLERATSSSGRAGREDERVAAVLRGLRVLRIERPQALICATPSARLCDPLPTPSLLSSLVTLDLSEWCAIYKPPSEARAVLFTRANLPSLRSLSLKVLPTSDVPFDIFDGGRDVAASLTPLLTRLDVDGEQIGSLQPMRWPRGEPLVVSARTLAVLAPTLRSLLTIRAHATAEGTSSESESDSGSDDDGDDAEDEEEEEEDPDPAAPRRTHDVHGPWRKYYDPMTQLATVLAPLSQFASLQIHGGHDWCPRGAGDEFRAWPRASRALMRPLALAGLQNLSIVEPHLSGTGLETHLPPSMSLLTSLTSLSIAGLDQPMPSAGPIRHLTGLRRLTIEIDKLAPDYYVDSDDEEPPEHAPVLGRDLQALVNLEHLQLSDSAPCYAPVLESGLPRLTSLVLRNFEPRSLALAVRARVEDDGLAAYLGDAGYNRVRDKFEAPHRLSANELQVMIEYMDDEESAERVEAHARLHQEIVDMVAMEEAEDAAAMAAAG